VIDRKLGSRRVVLCGSGGLSHFSPSHPWAHHVGSRYVGDISVEFDRRIVAWMRVGEGHRLAGLSSSELIEHGEAELRQWIVLLGAVGEAKPEFLVYEPPSHAHPHDAAEQWLVDEELRFRLADGTA